MKMDTHNWDKLQGDIVSPILANVMPDVIEVCCNKIHTTKIHFIHVVDDFSTMAPTKENIEVFHEPLAVTSSDFTNLTVMFYSYSSQHC